MSLLAHRKTKFCFTFWHDRQGILPVNFGFAGRGRKTLLFALLGFRRFAVLLLYSQIYNSFLFLKFCWFFFSFIITKFTIDLLFNSKKYVSLSLCVYSKFWFKYNIAWRGQYLVPIIINKCDMIDNVSRFTTTLKSLFPDNILIPNVYRC